MIYTGSVYFLGKYRPLYIEDDSIAKVKIRLSRAIQDTPPDLRQWLSDHISESFRNFSAYGYESVSVDHCDRGVGIRKGPHDNFLARVIAQLPDCPGLDYNA